MLVFHKLIGTWSKKVTAYVALTEFQKQKMIEGGLPAGKIFVKPNFIQITESTKEDLLTSRECKGAQRSALDTQCPVPNALQNYALFVGRLSPEKGCDILVQAWQQFQKNLKDNGSELIAGDPQPQLLIVGDGPERTAFESFVSSLTPHAQCPAPASVHFLGRKPKNEVLSLMEKARFLVFPSIWHETFGLTVLEADLGETPSIVSSPTTTSGLIADQENGLLYPLGDDGVLAKKLEWAFDHPCLFANPEKVQSLVSVGTLSPKWRSSTISRY